MNSMLSMAGLTFLLLSSQHGLAFNANEATGATIVPFSSPQQKREICVKPSHRENFRYSQADEQAEQRLCQYDLYGNTPNSDRVGVCPKISSTNPGINILLDRTTLKFPDFPLNCRKKDEKLTMVAKHKQSISCSYTPSILMYYHLSRRFGGILNIPVAVLRTIDKEEHLKWTNEALSYFPSSNDEIIYQNWKHYKKAHSIPEKYPRLFTDDHQFLYGALVMNINDEKFYGEVNGKGSYDTRELRFQQQPPFLRVSSAKTIDELTQGLGIADKIQMIVQLQDMSNMILLDYLLNQMDRVGNIHYLELHYAIEGQEVKVASVAFPGSTVIKQMILKDNDCGIIKENRFKKFQILEKVGHMSPKTYKTLLAWTNELQQKETQEFLQKEILLSSKDLFDPSTGLLANAKAAKAILMDRCRTGHLKLDLSLRDMDKPYNFNPADCEE